MPKIYVFAYAAQGKGLSGGDRIFIEFARRWRKSSKVQIFVNNEGKEMCRRQSLSADQNLSYEVWDSRRYMRVGFIVFYFAQIIYSIFKALRIDVPNQETTIIYSASEFWMDSIPALILKLRFPKIVWAASWYQTAPNPIKGYAEGKREKRYNFKALLYWISQFLIKPLVSAFADYVFVNNEVERKQFPILNKNGRLKVVIGAIDLERIKRWKKEHSNIKKGYDAVFQGRFHPQKGVIELIEIWRLVVTEKPKAKLAMIGDGPLMNAVRAKINKYDLSKNVNLLGYVFDGDLKYRTFSGSKVVLHPALYDSGGMASAEAMAFGLPVVGFNLRAYESYYPKGMVKVKIGDKKAFANATLDLLNHSDKRRKLAAEALSMLEKNWTWDERAGEVLAFIQHG